MASSWPKWSRQQHHPRLGRASNPVATAASAALERLNSQSPDGTLSGSAASSVDHGVGGVVAVPADSGGVADVRKAEDASAGDTD